MKALSREGIYHFYQSCIWKIAQQVLVYFFCHIRYPPDSIIKFIFSCVSIIYFIYKMINCHFSRLIIFIVLFHIKIIQFFYCFCCILAFNSFFYNILCQFFITFYFYTMYVPIDMRIIYFCIYRNKILYPVERISAILFCNNNGDSHSNTRCRTV